MSAKATNTRFSNYAAMADGVATLLFPHAEVVVHDLRSQTVVHIANNISRRQLGDDSALEDLPGELSATTPLGPYEKLNWNGQKVRSISSVMVDESGAAEALLCINFNISVLEQAKQALDLFFQASRLLPQPDVLFRDDWQERINTFLHAWLRQHGLSLDGLSREQKRELVEALHGEGAFRGGGTFDYVANILGMGRATVYKYVKLAREA
ncbi:MULTISPECIES: helix-turn-helix transcriptional regulator [unclassified Pseudomonas]|uniref:helix-turn-helix transcriptional regulator n=1 Tax=unclassified Pseudomonas TaxID=196821 RepID=UPI00194350A2|nr:MULTISPECIES: PAS domain-containing protein [unclassified Pseudomonas]MDC0688787.1 PAS domain-containing protein [Mitsuaria sp. RG]MCE0915939.1 PAS domain-containing protein [Pseudomonas sp. NMI760_13]MCP8633150.1 PAS domain-containing protein [Pseudomonas sp. DVZ6]MDD7785994.1 PAS domain-containing protein [Pseudomonas sp. DVZ24]BCJ09261.1 transcriptional regulator DauR [Pseudomonas sp. RtIB026]